MEDNILSFTMLYKYLKDSFIILYKFMKDNNQALYKYLKDIYISFGSNNATNVVFCSIMPNSSCTRN